MADSLREAITSASADLSAKPETSAPSTEAKSVEREAPEKSSGDDDAWDGPGWVNQWKKPSREKLRQLAKLEGANDLLPDIYKEIETRYDYTGKTQAEYDQYKKRWEPYNPILSGLEQRFALQGIPAQTGLQQMVAVNDLLQQDPDQGLAWLAQNFKPRDVKALLQNLAKHYEVDLSGLVAQQPYVDPVISQELSGLKQANAQLMQMFQGQYQQQYQQAAQTIAGSIKAFKEAKDEGGDPKYPHYDRLENSMTAILRAGGVPKQDGSRSMELHDLYEAAMWQDPQLREESISQRAQAANQKAIEEAKASNAIAEKAMTASRNVNGSGKSATKRNPTELRDLIREDSKRLGA